MTYAIQDLKTQVGIVALQLEDEAPSLFVC